MASYVPRIIEVPIAFDTEAIKRQLAILRTLVSQIGFALDAAILAFDGTAQADDSGASE